MTRIKSYYFTYGTSGQPYKGGWTRIDAPDLKSACDIFRFYHPDRVDGFLNCSDVYTEDRFFETGMHKTGNFGKWEQEIITLNRMVIGGAL